MNIKGKVAIITGGAGGIGKAVATKMLEKEAKSVFIADTKKDILEETAKEINAIPLFCDVTEEEQVRELVSKAVQKTGTVDVFMSNAGIYLEGNEYSPDKDWELNWKIHVMAHVYAARSVIPVMKSKGKGYLINTASAAGLLSHIDSATYATTKHACIGLSEYLAINHKTDGINVSVLCPQAVRTAMTENREKSVAAVDGMIEPDVVALKVLESMDKEEFLILPHEKVRTYVRRKGNDYERWISGMRKLTLKKDF